MSNTRRPRKLLSHETLVVLHSSGSQSQQALSFFNQIREISRALGNTKRKQKVLTPKFQQILKSEPLHATRTNGESRKSLAL